MMTSTKSGTQWSPLGDLEAKLQRSSRQGFPWQRMLPLEGQFETEKAGASLNETAQKARSKITMPHARPPIGLLRMGLSLPATRKKKPATQT